METTNSTGTVETADALPLACLDCGGARGGMAVVGMADEQFGACETCDGAGEALCQICCKARAVAVLTSPFRELACADCGGVDFAAIKAARS